MEQPTGSARGVGGQIALGARKRYQLKLEGHNFKVELRDAVLPEKGLVILGRDFLGENRNLWIDFSGRKLRVGDAEIYSIEEEFGSVFAENPKAPKCCNQGEHKIVTEGPAVKCKTWPLANKNREEVTKQIKVMLEAGIVTRSDSPYSQNVLLVDKADGGKRFCVDYRQLNKQTKDDPYPLTSVPELLRDMSGSRYFSQVDLASGYWTVPIRGEDQEKTAFVIPGLGKFHFLRMPFGLKNSQATLQRIMDQLANEVRDEFNEIHGEGGFCVGTYVDNLIWATQESEMHDELTRLVMKKVQQYNLSLRRDKCLFKQPSMEFLGFVVDGSTVKMAHHNRQKVIKAVQPSGKKEVRRFLGLVNFNRHFFDKYSTLMDPLYQVTGEKDRFQWGQRQQEAFQRVKDLMRDDPSLHLPVPGTRFHVDTDASESAVGGILYQVVDGRRQVINYFSKKLTKAQRNWTVTEKEFFAIVEASRKYRYECAEGVTFHTDHKPLTFAKGNLKTQGKHARWLLELEAANYEIHYTPGNENGAADCLSRLEVATLDKETDWVTAQERDPELAQVKKQIRQSGGVTKGRWKRDHLRISKEGVLCKGNRKVVPAEHQTALVKRFHREGHPGVEGTMTVLASRFAWKGMRKSVEAIVLQCRTCLQNKPGKRPKSPPTGTIAADRAPRERICVDFASMAPSHRGKDHMFVIADTVTGFSMAVPTRGETAEEAIRGIQQWHAVFGVPREILSDNGAAFHAARWKEYLAGLGVKPLFSTPYHPQGNGRAEKTVGLITQAVRCVLSEAGLSPHQWTEAIPTAMRMVNANRNRCTGISPFEAMLGGPSRMIEDNKTGVAWERGIPPEKASAAVELARKQQPENQTTDAGEEFVSGDEVLLKEQQGAFRKVRPLFREGYTIVKKVGPVNYVVRNGRGEEKVYHREKLRKAGQKWTSTLFIPPSATPPHQAGDTTSSGRYPSRERRPPDFYQGEW